MFRPLRKPAHLCTLLAAIMMLLGSAGGRTQERVAAEAPDAQYSAGWYRDVRMDMWLWEGARRDRLTAALERVRSGTGHRRWPHLFDTQTDYGPGHWTYEFEKEADDLLRSTSQPSRETFREAAVYYMIASYPHLKGDPARQALAKAFNAYEKAGVASPYGFESWSMSVDGVDFTAFVHLPKATGPHPVVLKTGGMDVLGIEFSPLADTLVSEGIAMVSFDMPGTGNDGIVDADAHKHHAAVLDRVRADPRFDRSRVAVWSESLGGLPAVKLAIVHGDRLSAAVNSCGLLHAVHGLALTPTPSELDLPAIIRAYASGRIAPDQAVEIEAAVSASPGYKARTETFQFEVYVERLGARSPGFLDLASKSWPISLVHQGLLGAGVRTSVPLLTINTQRDPIVPVTDSLLATQASSRGTLMLFGDHDGHCVARSLEMPAVLAWLKPRLIGQHAFPDSR